MRSWGVVLGAILVPALALGVAGTGDKGGPVSGNDTIRIGVATFSHETCTFCPNPTGIEEWEFYGPPMRGEEVLRAGSYIQGFVDRCGEYGGVELVGIYSPRNAKGGSSGSWITAEAFDKYSYGMADDLRQAGHLDGLYLSLHGAMAVTGVPKPEAELIRRLREAVGDIPIVVTLDLHANEDHELSDAADAVLIIKRYPHYDSALQGERAARMMIRITIKVGGYADRFAGNPVEIDANVEYLGRYGRFETVAVLLFGDNNRVILTPLLHQVTDTSIFRPLGIPLESLDIIVLKSRVHFRRGYYENGLAGAIFEVDAPGLGPADLTTINYKNIPKDIYPIYRRDY